MDVLNYNPEFHVYQSVYSVPRHKKQFWLTYADREFSLAYQVVYRRQEGWRATEQGQNLRKAGRKAYPQWHHKDALLRTLELTLHTLGCGALSATAPGPEAFILSLRFQVLNRNSQLSKSTCSVLNQEMRRRSLPL